MPVRVSIEEAEADFFGLLARVENGEEFVITRDGEPIVLFGPPGTWGESASSRD